MSADLFAEFNDLSKPSRPPQTQSSSSASFSQSQHGQAPAKDPFESFSSGTVPQVTPQPPPQWSSLQPQPGGGMGSWSSAPSQPQPSPIAEEDDGWGDFEVAEPSATTQPIAWQAPAPTPAPAPPPAPAPAPAMPRDPEPRTRIVRASTMDLMTNNLVDIGSGRSSGRQHGPVAAHPRQKVKPKAAATPSDPSVLFDVDDFELQPGDGDEGEDEEDDEFGEFETVDLPPQNPKPAPAKSQNPPPSLDLLLLDDTPEPPPQPPAQKQPPSQLLGTLSFGAASPNYPQAPKSPSYQDRNPFPELGIKTPTATEPSKGSALKSASPRTAWPTSKGKTSGQGTVVEDNDWAAWDEFPSGDGNKKADIDATQPPESWDWDAADSVRPAASESNDNAPPPVNVPPPSVILSAFPDLLNSGNSLFKPISGQSASIKQRVLADPKAVEFLQAYILIATTAGRVIAGRKHRWHRDKILAKSMSISAAGSKGMKLAGVDKTQSAREDRETADVIAVWREQVGRLRSAVAAANAAGKANLRVPELSDNLPVQSAKMVPTAPKACIICGLKREERVAKVDHDVEDSFGEWWVDHWGHRACKSFWIEHEQKLRQR